MTITALCGEVLAVRLLAQAATGEAKFNKEAFMFLSWPLEKVPV
jgi:hypothetical protein